MKITIITNRRNTEYTAKSDSMPCLQTSQGMQPAAETTADIYLDCSGSWYGGYSKQASGATPAEAEANLRALIASHVTAMDAHNLALSNRLAAIREHEDRGIAAQLLTMYKAGELYVNKNGVQKLAL